MRERQGQNPGHVSATLGKKKISVVDLEDRGKEIEIMEEKRKDG